MSDIINLCFIQISVAGGLGIAASSPVRLNTPGRGLVSELLISAYFITATESKHNCSYAIYVQNQVTRSVT